MKRLGGLQKYLAHPVGVGAASIFAEAGLRLCHHEEAVGASVTSAELR
jgi:hypothetical protein